MRQYLLILMAVLIVAAPLAAQARPSYQPPNKQEKAALRDDPELREVRGGEPLPPASLTPGEKEDLAAAEIEADDLGELKAGHRWRWWWDWGIWVIVPSSAVTLLLIILLLILLL